MRRVAVTLLAASCVGVGCASGEKTGTTPANGPSDFPASLGAARSEVEEAAKTVDTSLADCEAACKALASLDRAANRLCLVAEPQECSDARLRVDRARRTVFARCGGC